MPNACQELIPACATFAAGHDEMTAAPTKAAIMAALREDEAEPRPKLKRRHRAERRAGRKSE